MFSSISKKITSNYLSIIKLLLSTDYVLSSISTLCCVVTQRCHLVIVGLKKKAKKESLALESSMAWEIRWEGRCTGRREGVEKDAVRGRIAREAAG